MREPNESNMNFQDKAYEEAEKLRKSIPKGQAVELYDLSNPKQNHHMPLCIVFLVLNELLVAQDDPELGYDYQKEETFMDKVKTFLEGLYYKIRDEMDPTTRISAIFSCFCCFLIFLLVVTSL